jgi:hypothetical protein
MNGRKLPSPALVIAVLALFVSLSGTAVAAGVVPLAKRALTADNSKKLGGQTAGAIAASAAQRPGPASSAAGLITIKTTPYSIPPAGQNDFAVMCDAGQKAVGGGYDDPSGYVHPWDSRPTADGAGWRMYLEAANTAPAAQTGTVYAVCVR